jgi:Xaa-Pro aminopeptidase
MIKIMRLEKIRQVLADRKLDLLLVSQPENRRYLSGFTGSAGTLLITPRRAILATDFRYYEQVARQAPDWELARIKTTLDDLLPDLLDDLLPDRLDSQAVQRLGFESQHVSVDQFRRWNRSRGGVEWVRLKDAVEQIRAVKEEAEIEALRRSVALTDAAFEHLLGVIEPGMTERQAAWQIESYMRTHGASKVAFEPIVAAGPNGALPHARPGDRAIGEGEPIVIDVGCVVDGYCSDMTRTICLGKPPDHYLEVWNIVLRAHNAAKEAIRACVAGDAVDAAARDVIEEAGYGEQFGHGLGHGVGLVVHEKPRAGRTSEDVLESNMILTVEPGIYLPGEFGVRLEDMVVVRDDGIEALTGTAKEPVVV